MNFSLYIAKRYLISKSKNNAINTISRIASIGIVISGMSLFVVLSVFSGLRDFSVSFTNILQPDLVIYPTKGKSFVVSSDQLHQINTIEGVALSSKIIEEKVLLFYNSKEFIATLKAVDSNYTAINAIEKTIYLGEWLYPNTPQVVIGNGIAHKLSVGLFDYTNVFQLYMPKPGKGAIANPDQAFLKQNVVPVGIYSINEDLDYKYVYCSLEIAQQLLQFKPNQVTSIELKLDNFADETAIRQRLQQILNNSVVIKNKLELNDALYKMLNTENLVVYLIFTLVIIIALFNLIGSIIMMVLEKRKNLTTLYNIGVTLPELRNVFLLHGVLLTTISGTIGLILGFIIVVLQEQYQFIMITCTMPYPVKIELKNVFVVFFTISILGFIASKVASTVVRKKILD